MVYIMNLVCIRELAYLALFVCLNCPTISSAQVTNTAQSTEQTKLFSKGKSCRIFVGDEEVQKLHGVVFIGEHHGTNEIPEMVGDFICIVGFDGKKIHVAVEFPIDWSPALSEFINSGDDPAALENFFHHTNWGELVQTFPDGRTSIAFIKFLNYLRSLRNNGYQISISSFDTRPWEVPKIHTEIGMAEALTRSIEKDQADITLVIAGEFHTRLREKLADANFGPKQPMAFLVASARPQWAISSIVVTYSSGFIWGCVADGCQSLYQPSEIPLAERKLTMNNSEDPLGYSGNLYVGSVTSSPPFKF